MSDYAVVNPATGEQVKEYPTISGDELRAAIGRADAAYKSWSHTSTVAERAALIRKVGDLHKERAGELAEIIVREMGKPKAQAVGEVQFCGAIYHFYADNAEDLMADEPIELLGGDGTALVRRSSYGSLLGVMPWNYPYYQVARFAGPNLVIGNPILLKHAPQCPESAAAMQGIFDEAGFPEGTYQNIYATNEQIEWVIGDPRVHGVSVTGSERAGAAVAEIAGRNLKKVVLELGGSDPFILLGTDDLDGAVQAAAEARLENTGQACNAAKRFIVSEDLYDDFLAKFTESSSAPPSRATRAPRAPRSARSPRRPPPTGSRTRSTGRSRTAPRSSSAANATATSSNRRSSPGSSRAARPPRKSSSARSRRSTRSAPRRRR